MKKTNVKKNFSLAENVEPFQKIADQMAVYFEDRILASEVVNWMTTVNQSERESPCGEIDDFISNIGWSFLPNLIDCKDKKNRIEFLKSSLPQVFDTCGYMGSKTALSEIGKNYLTEFLKISADYEEVARFMKVYGVFLSLATLYGSYKFLRDECEGNSNS